MEEKIQKFIEHDFTCLPVVDRENRVVGILSERDVLAHAMSMGETAASTGNRDLVVEDFMTTDVVCIELTESFAALCICLVKNKFRRVPIVSKGRLVGIVSRKDVIKEVMSLQV